MQKQLRAAAKEAGILNDFLKTEWHLSKKQIRQAKFRPNGITVNGIQSRINAMLRPGDVVCITLEEADCGSHHLLPYEHPLAILYEDEDILAVNKPAKMVVHPSHGHYCDSLSNAVISYYMQKGLSVTVRSVGRLDKDTSGIVVFAKNQIASARLSVQRDNGLFQKEYLALVTSVPVPTFGTIRTNICKDVASLSKMKTAEHGMHAVTHYQVLQSFHEYSAVSLHLETGRTHQIRVHMSSIGYPLLGDILYGGSPELIQRTALHALRCRFCQPFSGKPIELEAPVPQDMETLM
ncbi:MAG: RluA family pseudouridine synthase [Eubacteriales bacterium]|nr:RluA family pseudouridine synthase [Eubacteriales bacterium]